MGKYRVIAWDNQYVTHEEEFENFYNALRRWYYLRNWYEHVELIEQD